MTAALAKNDLSTFRIWVQVHQPHREISPTTYILLKSISKVEVKYYSPTPPVDLPDPWPEARVIGHKVALFRRALTDYGVDIMPVGE